MANHNPQSNQLPQTPLRFLWYGIKPNKKWFFLSIFLVIISAALSQGSMYIFKVLVDAVESGDMSKATWSALSYPFLVLIIQVSYRGAGITMTILSTKSKSYIYNNLSALMLGHSKSYFSDRFAGSLVNKLHNVARGFDNMISDIVWTYVNAGVTLIVTAYFIFTISIWSGLVFILLVVALLVLNKFLSNKKRVLAKEEALARSTLSGKVADLFANIDATRQYVREQEELGVVSGATENVRSTSFKSSLYTEYMLLLNGLILFLSFAVITYLMITGWQNGSISSGELVFVFALFAQITGLLIFVGQSFQAAARSFGDIDEGLKEMVLPHEIKDASGAKELQIQQAAINWSEVDFSFEENAVFANFELTIPGGQRLGLVGQSGAGKTTFVSLLLRQHELSGGEISIDDQNIAQVTQDSLRRAIAVVPQEPALFHRTIKENILYGQPDATDDEVIAVAKKAQAHDFISELPEGYDTLVGERGVKLSGGQKQRVAIARAMLKDAPILVLDEATSALDSESEVEIQKALEVLMEGRTVIAIAHRLSTLRKMDRIIVMEAGQIKEDGDHDSLAQSCGIYQKLWNHQAGGILQE